MSLFFTKLYCTGVFPSFALYKKVKGIIPFGQRSKRGYLFYGVLGKQSLNDSSISLQVSAVAKYIVRSGPIITFRRHAETNITYQIGIWKFPDCSINILCSFFYLNRHQAYLSLAPIDIQEQLLKQDKHETTILPVKKLILNSLY